MSETRFEAVQSTPLPVIARRERTAVRVLMVLVVLLSLVPLAVHRAVAAPADTGRTVARARTAQHVGGELDAARRAARVGGKQCEQFGWGSDACDAVIDTVAAAAPEGARVIADADAGRITIVYPYFAA